MIDEGTETSRPLSRSVGDQGRDGQFHLCARFRFAPEVQLGADSIRPFANARQTPVAVPAASKDFRVNPLSVIADMQAKNASPVSNLNFDLPCVCVLKSIPQQFAAYVTDFRKHGRLQLPPLAFHDHAEAQRMLSCLLAGELLSRDGQQRLQISRVCRLTSQF